MQGAILQKDKWIDFCGLQLDFYLERLRWNIYKEHFLCHLGCPPHLTQSLRRSTIKQTIIFTETCAQKCVKTFFSPQPLTVYRQLEKVAGTSPILLQQNEANSITIFAQYGHSHVETRWQWLVRVVSVSMATTVANDELVWSPRSFYWKRLGRISQSSVQGGGGHQTPHVFIESFDWSVYHLNNLWSRKKH